MNTSFSDQDHIFMQAALKEAKAAGQRDEVPIGAVLTDPQTNQIITANGNRTIELSDPTAHAEILCIRDICQQNQSQRAPQYNLYVTLEPCTMCTAALSFARIRRVIFGAPDPKGGGILQGAKFYASPTCHHKPDISHGLMAEECSQILKDFFKQRRKIKK